MLEFSRFYHFILLFAVKLNINTTLANRYFFDIVFKDNFAIVDTVNRIAVWTACRLAVSINFKGVCMIVSFLNQKGGVGKTTLAINVAYWFKKQGASVLLIDSDPQGSARNWHNESGGIKLEVIGLDRPTLDVDVKNLNFKHDWIFIDGVPQVSVMAAKAVKCSDVVLIPVQPSPYDVWASEDIVGLIKNSQEFSKKPKAAFIINRKIGNSNLGKEVKEALSGYDLPIFNSTASQRVIYAQTAAIGNTVFDVSENEASLEVASIAQELMRFTND